jgi:hypothetical protein
MLGQLHARGGKQPAAWQDVGYYYRSCRGHAKLFQKCTPLHISLNSKFKSSKFKERLSL